MAEPHSILLPFLYRMTAWILEYTPFVLPIKYLAETSTLLAFRHPKPAYPFHVLLMPKKKVHSLAELEPGDPFLADLIRITHKLVMDNGLTAYRLIVNGGDYQEFPHLHFHLVSDHPGDACIAQ